MGNEVKVEIPMYLYLKLEDAYNQLLSAEIAAGESFWEMTDYNGTVGKLKEACDELFRI